MVIVGFEDKRGGQRRITVQDLVGGRFLHEETAPVDLAIPDADALFLWSWTDPELLRSKSRLVTKDVMKTAPTNLPPGVAEQLALETVTFPANGGMGMVAQALWAWYPAEGVLDELMFPRRAEVREARNVNGDWWEGVYMGQKGVFPAPYVGNVAGVGEAK